jgi:hypothetical protein
MRERFLAELRELVDAWHAAELDFPTFTACKADTWNAIRKAGPAVEAEVLRALRDQLPATSTGALKLATSDGHINGAHTKS